MPASASPLTAVLAKKIDEDLSLIVEMLALVPAGKGGWRPEWPASTAGEAAFTVERLAGHLAESAGGICACLFRLYPKELAHFDALKQQIARAKTPALSDAQGLLAMCRSRAAEGFALATDADLARLVPAPFTPGGEPFLEILLSNLKHVNHHAYQLFLYLKLLGVPVGTRHLYRFKERK